MTTQEINSIDTADSTKSKLRWYVVQALAGKEAQVKKLLLDRIALEGLEHKFGEILVPTEEVVEVRSGKKRRSERKLFPGYVFVQMLMDEETWYLVKKTDQVSGFIGGTPDRPAPLSDKDAQAILDQLEQNVDKPRPKVMFRSGEEVRITEGPFSDFVGIVEAVDIEKNRLTVSVSIFGRATPVELEFGQVVKV